ncbi:MAG: ABC transporter ATP-binding protein [Gammaproteobacteria bacterium]|nr:ABC transporter ATP-binding protein [Gammaproteobacteria bacterium]
MSRLLAVTGLNVRFRTEGGALDAVSDLGFAVHAGECLGIVGESGSGKSQTFLAILGLLAANGSATGSARFDGQELLNAPPASMNELRGNRIAMIFQDALSGLTPTMRIGEQMVEVLAVHRGLGAAEARRRVLEVLQIVRIPDAQRRLRAYPFELSGGMRQRVMIALAMLCNPDLLIADEPTTALDVTVQAQVLKLLAGLKRHTGSGIVLITHDLAVVAGLSDRVMIMYAGRAVESGPVREIFSTPLHPYTIGLLRSVPGLEHDPAVELPTIAGQPPDLARLPPGCPFAARCGRVIDRCLTDLPPLRELRPGHLAACHRAGEP